jgi:hypothetical protein
MPVPPASRHPIRVDHDTAGDTYRCFLPDLTGFVFVCCEVSNGHKDLKRMAPVSPSEGIQPR